MPLLRTMRPRQWPKNAFIFAPLVFDLQLYRMESLVRIGLGFVLLCLASSVVYTINDLLDLKADRAHPTKRHRPLAAGELAPGVAIGAAVVLGLVTIAGAFTLGGTFAAIVLAYLVLNLLYSFGLKHIPIVDVFVVAAGFLLRVGAGVSLIVVERFSPWLYVCTTLLALFIAFGKRRAEIVLLRDRARTTRRVLDGYTLPLLDHLISIVSATTIAAYSLYTFSAENLPGNHLMMLTIPFVLYGIFRYLYLIHVEDAGGSPEELVLTDRPLGAAILLWGLTATAILYLG
ncbi:MAG: decaprenyl-phosphate phosphoribosyltransferase [Anaerolineales bacterium]